MLLPANEIVSPANYKQKSKAEVTMFAHTQQVSRAGIAIDVSSLVLLLVG